MKHTIKVIILVLLSLFLAAPAFAEEMTLKSIGGAHKVPVTLNGVLTLDFMVDTGAADVGLSDEITQRLISTGAFNKKDLKSFATYTMADGTSIKCRTLLIRSIRIGSRDVSNVEASTCPKNASLLLGQSFWDKLGATLAFKKKGELVVAFESGASSMIPSVEPATTPARPVIATAQTVTPLAHTTTSIPKAVIRKTQSKCDFEIEKYLNAPSPHDTNSSWICNFSNPSLGMGGGEFQIFGDGTGFQNTDMFTWKRTGCNSIATEITVGDRIIKGAVENITGDTTYGVSTFTVRTSRDDSVYNFVCMLQKVKFSHELDCLTYCDASKCVYEPTVKRHLCTGR